MTSSSGSEADWSSFKYIAPSQDVHAPLGSPPSRSPGHFFLAHDSKQLSPPCSDLRGGRSTASPAQSLGEKEKPLGVEGTEGEADMEGKEDVRERVLGKLGLDEEGQAVDAGQAAKSQEEEEREKKYVGVGPTPDTAAGEASLDPAHIKQRLAIPDGPPSPASASLSPLSSSLKLDPDPSIPLPTRLAGRLEATLGKLKKDEKMILDGRVREFGVEAVGLPGEVREAMLSERGEVKQVEKKEERD